MQLEAGGDTMPETIFIHSLFRSGSTYIYNALQRTGQFHIYHEPMHEVIASLPSSWKEMISRKDQLKSTLRHDFLRGGYFDEFSHLLPSIKETFSEKVSFGYYFLNEGDQAPELKAYIDLLVNGALKYPILQCTRTSGRISWLKENYKSKHVFLLRNPWDQWLSYKVDPYITVTPRLIYSQSNVPAVLKSVLAASEVSPLLEGNTQEKIDFAFKHPLSSSRDYFLFFGLWVYSFICGKQKCDVVVDMDALSSTAAYRTLCFAELEAVGIHSVDFSDANLHRAAFESREQLKFGIVEEKVLEIYQQHEFQLELVRDYLQEARRQTFVSIEKLDVPASGILEDARRIRELLNTRDDRIAGLSQTLGEYEEQIAGLSQTLGEYEEQIARLNRTVVKRDAAIQAMHASNSWKITAPFRKLRSMFSQKENLNRNE